MSDISMCNNPNCSIKEFCYRHLATPGEMQCYILLDKAVDNSDDCDMFWECVSKEILDKFNKQWRD